MVTTVALCRVQLEVFVTPTRPGVHWVPVPLAVAPKFLLKEPRVRFPPWAIFSEGERGWVDWPEPAPRGSWIIAELCKWKIDCVG